MLKKLAKITVLLGFCMFVLLMNGYFQVRYQLYLDHDIAYLASHCEAVTDEADLRNNLIQSSPLFGGGDYIYDRTAYESVAAQGFLIGSRDVVMAFSCVPIFGCLVRPIVRNNDFDGCLAG